MDDEGLSSGGDLAKRLADAETRKEKEDILSASQSRDVKDNHKRKEKAFKAAHGTLVAFLTLILVLHALGIYLFTNGFLLTRLVLDHKSECSIPPITLNGSHQAGTTADGCWHPKSFDKAVVILIDALRYDFTVPFHSSDSNKEPHYFHNALQILYETSIAQQNNAFLRPFIADPPTTTLQRLKGLTTGSLPTFIDAGSNFAGTAIDEDNLVAQLRAAGKNIVHLGDDTWHSLFPGYFDANLTRSYHSLTTYDLHTVDNGVSEHLMPLLHPSNSSKWDIIVAHYLGVDHAGHTYGPDHPAMTAKLKQMDTVLRQVIELVDDQTLLIVMGDHGMDVKGDHGGESADELEAALWMYSKRHHFGRSSTEYAYPPNTAKERPVAQIDLVPTFALLLGLPIPFNNLGGPIEEAFIGVRGVDWENSALVNRLAAAQIHRYQQEYALVRKPDPALTIMPLQSWGSAIHMWDQKVNSRTNLRKEEWQDIIDAFSSYQQLNLNVCKALWARFDLMSISMGIAITLFTLLIVVVEARILTGDISQLNATLLLRGIVSLILGAALGVSLAFRWPGLGFTPVMLVSAALACCSTISFTLWSGRGRLAGLVPRSMWSWTCVVSVLLLSIGFGSNSYTIWEDEILLFLLATFGMLMVAQSFRLRSARDRTFGLCHSLLFMVAIRFASLSRLCREEQMPICKATFYASETSSTSAPWQLSISYIIAIALPSVFKLYYQQTHSYSGSAPFWVGVGFRITLLLIAVFWTLDAADDGEWLNVSKDGLKTVRMYIAQLVLFIAAGAGTATFAFQAPLISIDTFRPKSRAKSKEPSAMSRPSKGSNPASLNSRAPEPDILKPQIMVRGTTNLYGSHFAILPLTVILLPLLLLQKPMGQAALALVTLAILSLLELLHLLQQPHSRTSASANRRKSSASPLGPTILALLGHFAYFKTGHQAALSSIQWNVAYIPLRTLRYPWSPLLIIFNTFAGQILCAAAVPCVVLWRRPYKFSVGSTSISNNSTMFSPPSPTPTGSEQGNVNSSEDSVPKAVPQQSDGRDEDRRAILTDLARAHLTHILVYSTINLATTVFAAHLRRHLMLYRVFCPRWMLGVAGLVVAEVVGCFVGVGGIRWTVVALASLFGW